MRLNIKDKLDESGMTRYELAKRVNVTYQTITNNADNGDLESIEELQ